MFAKLEGLEKKYMELEEALAQPDVFNDQEHYRKLTKAHADLREIVDLFRRHRALQQEMAENKQLLHDEDPDIRDMAHEEIRRAESELPRIEQALKVALLPTDPLDEKNTILEIRAGTGGEEAALFAHSLFRMYSMYADARRWKVEVDSVNETELGGIKEICFTIEGDGAYSRLKFESGVHRVQRVPETKSGGRIHTSTATVAVLLLALRANLRGREQVTFRGRAIPFSQVLNAMTLTLVVLFVFLIASMVISTVEGLPYLNCAYEVASAMGTVGLTTGITPELTRISQSILIVLMYLGRVGILSFSIALMTGKRRPAKLHYPEINVMIG